MAQKKALTEQEIAELCQNPDGSFSERCVEDLEPRMIILTPSEPAPKRAGFLHCRAEPGPRESY